MTNQRCTLLFTKGFYPTGFFLGKISMRHLLSVLLSKGECCDIGGTTEAYKMLHDKIIILIDMMLHDKFVGCQQLL